MTAKPKRKPRKVVVWAVVWNDDEGTVLGHHPAYSTRSGALAYCNQMKGKNGRCFQRVVRCEGVLR
jgi:hypothetical protein